MNRRHATKPEHNTDLDEWFGRVLLFIGGGAFVMMIDLFMRAG